jgi:hypothetical protein
MFENYAWQNVPGQQAEPFLKLVNPIQGKFTANPETATVKWAQVPFYKSVALVQIHDSTWPPGKGVFWFLAKQGKMFLLDGSSAPIHDANEADPILVTEDNCLEYLRFFCFFVHGDEGPFFVIEGLDHPALDSEKMDDSMRKTIEAALLPVTYEGRAEDGNLETTAMVLYGNALFSARFAMSPSGMIEMTDDEPIAADLPVKKIKDNY